MGTIRAQKATRATTRKADTKVRARSHLDALDEAPKTVHRYSRPGDKRYVEKKLRPPKRKPVPSFSTEMPEPKRNVVRLPRGLLGGSSETRAKATQKVPDAKQSTRVLEQALGIEQRALFSDESLGRDPAVRELYLRLLKKDVCLFAKDVLGIEIGPHILDWGEAVHTFARLAVNAARDHSKSTFFSYAVPIFRAWSEPGVEVYLFSKTMEQATEFLDIILYGRDNLPGMVDIPFLSHLVPDKRSKSAKTWLKKADVKFTNGSRIRCAGYGKAMRGRHPKYIILDDPLNDEDMWSETVRRKNIEYFKSAITNMVKPDGQILVVGTPYHLNDLYGFLKENKRYTFLRYAAIQKDEQGKEYALFPWRWKLEDLYNKKLEIGSVAFAREILCKPISDDISIFPSTLFPPCYDDDLKMRPKLSALRAAGWQTFIGVDIAKSASVGADYFVIFVIAKTPDNRHVLLDISRTKGLSFYAQLEKIKLYAKRYDPSLIYIEANAMQAVYSEEMQRTTDLPVKPFVTLATNKYPLDRGVPSLRLMLELGKLVIPRGDEYSIQTTDIWIDECTQFGFVDGKMQGIGAHDDTVMAWWLATEAMKAGGFSFSSGDDDEEAADDDLTGVGGEDENWESVLIGDDDEEDQKPVVDMDDEELDEEFDTVAPRQSIPLGRKTPASGVGQGR